MSPGSDPTRLAASDDRAALEAAVRRFETAWQAGSRPAIDDYLPDSPVLRHDVLVELVHIELELRLKAREAARVEEYLARYPSITDDRAAVAELVVAEFELRRRAEPELTCDEHARRFADYRAELSVRFGAVATAPARPAPTGPAEPAPEVPGYEVEGLLGRGGMGVVYRARQLSLNRPVALKLLPAACARDPDWLARFRREALTASALNHPNICTIHDAGDAAGRPFISMELVGGRGLESLVGQNPAVEEVAEIVRQAARALASAHAAGVVHRDVKPANLMLRPDGIVKVLDFGLARLVAGPGGTDLGMPVGTLLYMSPEQARGGRVDGATDVFALGLVLYELLTGEHPFRADAEYAILHAIATHDPVPPSRRNPLVPAILDALILRMLAKTPHARPTACEVADALANLDAAAAPRSPPTPPRVTVGREGELIALRAAFDAAAAGRGSVVCVTGDAGMGKTTLVAEFLDGVLAGSCATARGHCSELLAGTEAYLPILEALEDLLRGPVGPFAARVMKTMAPSWYAQVIPPAAGSATGEPPRPPRERLEREFHQLLTELSRSRPVVLFLDDVHWADPSSVDLLAYLGGWCAGMRVLVVVTYRPADLLLSRHPFGRVRLDLQARGVCREVVLPSLTRDDLDQYLASAFAGHQFPHEFADAVHARTSGHPLFVVDLLRYLCDRGVLVADNGRWAVAGGGPDFHNDLPESVRSMVQRKLDQLDEADYQLMMAASVEGPEFESAVVACVLGRAPADVEERLHELGRVHALVRPIREHEFPDRTLTVRYAFAHLLYQNALYDALTPTRRAEWSGAAARALLAHHGDKAPAAATPLALLFEAAREPTRAVEFYRLAAEGAVRAFAHREAAGLARRGLTALATLPATPDRDRQELALLMALGVSLVATEGFASAEVERVYNRARVVAEQGDNPAAVLPVLYGLWNVSLLRSELGRCSEMASQIYLRAVGQADPVHLLQAHNVLQQPLLHLGEFASARDHQERSLALYDAHRHRELTAVYGEDPGIGCLAYRAVALWCLGHPDQAVRSARAARALAEAGVNPFDLARALYFGAFTHLCRREPEPVRELADALADVSREHGYPLLVAGATILRGWSLLAGGRAADGLPLMRDGMAAWQATGAVSHRPYQFALLAEALGREGRTEEALSTLDEGLTLVEATEERFLEAELHRIRGELLLRAGGEDAAEGCFRRAVGIARCQQARSLELRAAVGLTRLIRQRGEESENDGLLAGVFNFFSEGFDTLDWQEANALLDRDR